MIDDFISLFFPRFCLGCNGTLLKGEKHVCIYCYTNVESTNSHLEKDNFIKQKFYGKVNVSKALAYFVFLKGGIVQHLLHNLKYENQPDLGVELGIRYAAELLNYSEVWPFELIVPVPLHRSKLKLRGYNQSEEFAKGLASTLNTPINSALRRIKATTTQTSKSRLERWKNVHQIFEVIDKEVVGKHILLVDDVITTGSTLESCVQVLIEAGASEVSVMAIAAAR